VGQFCTNPGLAVGMLDENFARFAEKLGGLITSAQPGTMLYPGILQSYEAGVKRLGALEGLQTTRSRIEADPAKTEALPTVFYTNARTFARHHELSEEVFGPSTVVVSCNTRDEMEQIARNLEGHLTATIHGAPEDLRDYSRLISILENKVGRLIFNGYPTGVEVCASMHHGGPYPATTDSRSTSVGTAAIHRFARPVCYQNFPQEALPIELRDVNQRGLWRLVDGQLTKENL
jgi:alpha-ketoglutaric semialdehyde dehydrogenase